MLSSAVLWLPSLYPHCNALLASHCWPEAVILPLSVARLIVWPHIAIFDTCRHSAALWLMMLQKRGLLRGEAASIAALIACNNDKNSDWWTGLPKQWLFCYLSEKNKQCVWKMFLKLIDVWMSESMKLGNVLTKLFRKCFHYFLALLVLYFYNIAAVISLLTELIFS